MSEISSSDWSETDASNNAAAPNGWPEGMLPSSVNDAGRAMMGALKRAWSRDHATATVGGTANAITLTYDAGPASYVTGERFAFVATAANTGAATLDVSGLGAKNLYKPGASGPTALVGGEIQIGQLVLADYDGTQFVMTSPVAGAGRVSDATNGGVSVSSAGAISLDLNDLTSKASPTTSDSVGIIDAAASNATKKATISSVLALAPFSKSFVSSQQTITAAGTLTIAHGLGAQPTLIQPWLHCVTGEFGYTAGDEMPTNPGYSSDDGAAPRGLSIVCDATNLVVRFGSDARSLMVVDKSAGSRQGITNANWKIIFKAWA